MRRRRPRSTRGLARQGKKKLLYPHIFLSPRPPIILIYGLLTSEAKFITPVNKIGKIESSPDYTNLPHVFHAEKNCTNMNEKMKA
jgi:hypothetical protein